MRRGYDMSIVDRGKGTPETRLVPNLVSPTCADRIARILVNLYSCDTFPEACMLTEGAVEAYSETCQEVFALARQVLEAQRKKKERARQREEDERELAEKQEMFRQLRGMLRAIDEASKRADAQWHADMDRKQKMREIWWKKHLPALQENMKRIDEEFKAKREASGL